MQGERVHTPATASHDVTFATIAARQPALPPDSAYGRDANLTAPWCSVCDPDGAGLLEPRHARSAPEHGCNAVRDRLLTGGGGPDHEGERSGEVAYEHDSGLLAPCRALEPKRSLPRRAWTDQD